ncbi:hypothetical protein [Psychrobacter faecalis]|uniref:hypothetical protein n=1 Tax=Psychrobacter faecalis TaxID=180588 RepID=UPI00186809C4|nr:hypothetical protein [Psychrobacter faecalis]
MENESLMGCGLFLLYIAFFFITGTIAFNIVEPHSFIGVLIFLAVWAIVQVVCQAILVGLISLLAR